MTRRRRSKPATNSRVTVVLLLVAVALLLSEEWYGRLLLALVTLGVPALLIALRIYPHWSQTRRFRALELDDVDSMPGHEFEHYVARLMEHQGFRTTVTKGSGDLGVDIIAHKDSARYAVQCKRYNADIPRTAVSDAVAGKQYYRCTHAMVVTNRNFTPGAVELAKSTQCVLVGRDTLADWGRSFQQQERAQQPITTGGSPSTGAHASDRRGSGLFRRALVVELAQRLMRWARNENNLDEGPS